MLLRSRSVVFSLFSLFAAGLLALPSAFAQAPAGVPLMKESIKPAAATAATAAAASAAKPGEPRTITWDALVPANWDPFK